jgi:predicted outer membrane repeat protein
VDSVIDGVCFFAVVDLERNHQGLVTIVDAPSPVNMIDNITIKRSLTTHGVVSVLDSQVVIKNSAFIGNEAYQGGAIYSRAAIVNVSETVFINNSALARGGAMYSVETDVELNNCTFDRNWDKSGVANVLYLECRRVVINAVTTGNQQHGFMYTESGKAVLLIKHSRFSDDYRGAIVTTAIRPHMVNSSFGCRYRCTEHCNQPYNELGPFAPARLKLERARKERKMAVAEFRPVEEVSERVPWEVRGDKPRIPTNKPLVALVFVQQFFWRFYIIPMAVVGLGLVYAAYVREVQEKKKTE